MTISCYRRVSRRNQKNDAQQAEVGKWRVGHDHDPAGVQWFMDTETGKTTNRPAFNRLREAVFAGTVKTIVVYKLDRIGRRLRLEFRREHEAAGIAVAKKRGVYKGRVTGTFKSNPDRARELQVMGLHVAEIATALCISQRTVFRYLRPQR